MAADALIFVAAEGMQLAGEESGEGQPIVLLHGLTATRRYVVMGSKLLERSGHRVIAYDARGHGCSRPAPRPDAYTYAHLSDDLRHVFDGLDLERATIVGASMGAHTAVRFALEHPARITGLVLVTPAYDPGEADDGDDGQADDGDDGRADDGVDGRADGDTRASRPSGWGPFAEDAFAEWDALARGLREGGVEGFMAAYDFGSVPPSWRDTVRKVVRQRLSEHEHPQAVADALRCVPRSRPFERFAQLSEIAAPTVVVGSRDQADPSHPLEVAERYAQAIPGATLVVEDPGPPARSPIAWQGGQLSKVIVELARRAS